MKLPPSSGVVCAEPAYKSLLLSARLSLSLSLSLSVSLSLDIGGTDSEKREESFLKPTTNLPSLIHIPTARRGMEGGLSVVTKLHVAGYMFGDYSCRRVSLLCKRYAINLYKHKIYQTYMYNKFGIVQVVTK